MAFKIGDKVILKEGTPLYKSSNALISATKLKASKVTNITRVVSARHPYNTTGDLGWCDENYIMPYEQEKKYEGELTLIDKNGLVDYLKEHDDKILVLSSEQLKDIMGW